MGLNEVQKKVRSEYLEDHLVITECSQRKPYVFISYASDNWETVFKTAIVPMQQKYGLCVYADKAFDKVNDKWIVPMLRNVRGADAIVAFISQSYIESYACFLEMLTAVNNKKPIIFVSLEEQLHLGDTTDQPVIERGAKSEILNQGGNIATNTNNTSNDIMRAMKSAYTSISTLLEQDALSKYDISDAFINFFRDAAINRKTINDLGAVEGTIASVSEAVFDDSLIGVDPKQQHKSYVQPAASDAPVQPTASVKPAIFAAAESGIRNDIPRSAASPTGAVSAVGEMPAAPTGEHADRASASGGFISKLKKSKRLPIILGACVAAVIIIIIIAASAPKNVKDMPYISYMLMEILDAEDQMEWAGRYTGKWKNNMPQGEGTIIYDLSEIDSGTVTYSGEWSNGKANGHGVLSLEYDGDTASREGEWKDNKLYGQGTETISDGSSYEGEWSDNKYNGYGKMIYANGNVYEGEWKDGYSNGQGKMVYANGDVYKGEFKDDCCDGQGKMDFADGRKYEGEWNNNFCHGQGKMTFANGDSWEGPWENGTANGNGVYTYANGTRENITYENGQIPGSSTNSTTAESNTYTVSLQAICEQNAFMNQYDIDVIVDSEVIDTLLHGKTKTYTLTLQGGNHYIGFRLHQFPTSKAGETLNIQGNASVSYGIRCTLGNNIEVVRA